MQQVCRKLYTRLGRNELRRLWWIADRAMQGLRDGSIDNDPPLRRLFARLDLTLKAMVEGGEYGPSSDTITALSRALPLRERRRGRAARRPTPCGSASAWKN
jgi:hypothetical protein